jgi:hypothetical protein
VTAALEDEDEGRVDLRYRRYDGCTTRSDCRTEKCLSFILFSRRRRRRCMYTCIYKCITSIVPVLTLRDIL